MTPEEYVQSLLAVIGEQAVEIRYWKQVVESLKAQLMQKNPPEHDEHGIGYPGTASYEDGPESSS